MMQPNDMGRYRQADLLREAEAFRLTKSTRAARAAERRTAARRVVTHAVSMLLWPIKH
jgi:hypothetical protein